MRLLFAPVASDRSRFDVRQTAGRHPNERATTSFKSDPCPTGIRSSGRSIDSALRSQSFASRDGVTPDGLTFVREDHSVTRDELGDDGKVLLRLFFHDPMAGVGDDGSLDIARDEFPT